MKKRRGHYCWACGRVLANEKFSGRGHRDHICKACNSARRRARRAAAAAAGAEVPRASTDPNSGSGRTADTVRHPPRRASNALPAPRTVRAESTPWLDEAQDPDGDDPFAVPDETAGSSFDEAVMCVVQEAGRRRSPVGRGTVWAAIVEGFRESGCCDGALIDVVEQMIDELLGSLHVSALREVWLGSESGADDHDLVDRMPAGGLHMFLATELLAGVTDAASDAAR